jgi:hypothetical protein
MSRHLIPLNSSADKARAARYIAQAPFGSRVEIKASKRSLPQNDRLWAMLTDIAAQKEHCGRKYTPETWKCLMMHAWGREVEFIPSLDGEVIAIGYRSSDLTKQEMSTLIDFMLSWGAENGVVFHDDPALMRMAG